MRAEAGQVWEAKMRGDTEMEQVKAEYMLIVIITVKK